MGLFKKVLQGTEKVADKVYDAKITAETKVFKDHRFGRAEKLAATGDANEAVITGIKRRYNNSMTDTVIRLEWYGPEPRVGAILYGSAMPLAIRLGATVAIKADGDTAVVDPAAMAGAPAAPQDAGRSARNAPDQGMDDQALDSRVLSRIKKWTPQDATVKSFEQARVMGMLSNNWTIVVEGDDGAQTIVSKDEVPPYAQWYVAPGAVVPIVTDPKDPARAQVNWPALAERHAEIGGTWRDRPPAGSIAANRLLDHDSADQTPAMAIGEEIDLEPSTESADAIEGVTIERWAYVEAVLVKAAVPPAEYDAYAAGLGIPAGRWSAIKGEWEMRQRSDWKVGAAFGEAYETAQKELRKKS